jgi:hypothetical protein
MSHDKTILARCCRDTGVLERRIHLRRVVFSSSLRFKETSGLPGFFIVGKRILSLSRKKRCRISETFSTGRPFDFAIDVLPFPSAQDRIIKAICLESDRVAAVSKVRRSSCVRLIGSGRLPRRSRSKPTNREARNLRRKHPTVTLANPISRATTVSLLPKAQARITAARRRMAAGTSRPVVHSSSLTRSVGRKFMRGTAFPGRVQGFSVSNVVAPT